MSDKIVRKLHNPKSHAPAVYIPCWLIQVPSTELSHQSKIIYGRLSQWSTTKCTVTRSVRELSEEMGMNKNTIERGLKELRDVGLIGTYQAISGGRNCYVFYEHEWMGRPLVEALDRYEESYPHHLDAPPTQTSVPPIKSDGTPPSEMMVPPIKSDVLKVKEIKEIKKTRARAKSVDKTKSASRSSDCLRTKSKSVTPIPKDFEPDAKGGEILWKTAERVKMPSVELLQKFIDVSVKYKTKSADWQATFIEFMEREKPKRTYEDANGKIRRYDGGQLHY